MPDASGEILLYTDDNRNGARISRDGSQGWSTREVKRVRVILADDQPKVRSALRVLLGQQPDIEVVGEAAEIEQLLLLVEDTHPDLILLAWELPGVSANGRYSALRALRPDLRVIALSGRPEAQRSALIAGADAFVSKVDPPERLLTTLKALGEEIREGRQNA
jgi:DNA-binding NarL/FixJ family response regulator